MDFLKFYFSKLFKKWWILIIGTPKTHYFILELLRYYNFPDDKYKIVEEIINQYKVYSPWLLLLYFVVVNIVVIYILWKKTKSLETTSIPTGLNDDYETIADLIGEISPTNYNSFLKKLKMAYKNYTKQNSVNNIICTHFRVYFMINKILIDSYKERMGTRSTEKTQLMEIFTDKYSEIKRLNDEVGKKGKIDNDLFSINKLISDIHNILKSLLSYY